nr:hypothetical protein [Pseudomonas schmalbachii]
MSLHAALTALFEQGAAFLYRQRTYQPCGALDAMGKAHEAFPVTLSQQGFDLIGIITVAGANLLYQALHQLRIVAGYIFEGMNVEGTRTAPCRRHWWNMPMAFSNTFTPDWLEQAVPHLSSPPLRFHTI